MASGGTDNPAVEGSWDPFFGWKNEKPTELTFRRIKRDILSIFNEPPPGIIVMPDKDDMTMVHALVTGPADTPYEGGFFYFVIGCPPDYPIKPPRVKLLTTGNNTVRFNPNLYKNGKVCLSILGTWRGPSWSPAMNLSTLLISIQSLLNEKPFHNEPGYEQIERTPGDAALYSKIIQHETVRVAVCDVLEKKSPCLENFRDILNKSFHNFYDFYINICTSNIQLNGSQMIDPFGDKRGRYCYSDILKRLEQLKSTIPISESDCSSSSDNDVESFDNGDDAAS